jgi:hypothetical protein
MFEEILGYHIDDNKLLDNMQIMVKEEIFEEVLVDDLDAIDCWNFSGDVD